MIHFLKYHKTIGIILIVTLLSLLDTSGIEPKRMHSIPNFDKIVHFLMYFTMTFFLIFDYYLHHKHKISKKVYLLIIPLSWGGAMELAQLWFTNYRGAEWMDMLANTIGVILAYFAFYLLRDNRLFNKIMLFPFINHKIKA